MATYLGHQEDSSGNILLPTPHSMATQIEFGTTASQAYAKGAYVVFNNRLCKASTAIASGDTLAIGTNLVQCSIGSELNSHLQAPNGSEFYFDYKDNKPGFYPSASKVASEFVPFGGSTLPEPIQTMVDNGFVLVEEKSYITLNNQRACKKDTSEKVVVFCHTSGNNYMGWGLAGLTSTSVQTTGQTDHSNTQYGTYTLPSGRVIHYGYMESQYGGMSNYITATVGGQTKTLTMVGVTPFILPICAYLLGVE